jgi:hypothetical protein
MARAKYLWFAPVGRGFPGSFLKEAVGSRFCLEAVLN